MFYARSCGSRLMMSFRQSEHSGTLNDMALEVSTQPTLTIPCIPKVVLRVWPEPSWIRSLSSSSTEQKARHGLRKMWKCGVGSLQIGKWWIRRSHQTNPMAPNGMWRVKCHPVGTTRQPKKREVLMANYGEQPYREVGHKRAVKTQMSPLKPSVERHAPSASSISRRGTTSGCYLVKASTGSIKLVSTRGYWSSRVHARCAARVSNPRPLSFRVNLLSTDFYALENMISGRSEDQHGVHENDYEREHPPLRGRFSRYLRFATRRRGGGSHREHSVYYDPTYPPAPTPPHQDERN
jgi:hypothetical protein